MSTLPTIQPHTKAKHEILRYHLNEWFPILGRSHKKLRYIDGFAGPGEYAGGEPGSPLIALDAVKRHQYFETFVIDSRVIEFHFVEKSSGYYRHLQRKVGEASWPKAFNIEVRHREFERSLGSLLDEAEAHGGQMPPTLVFIDPFGPAGFSMELLKRLASFDRVDVLINLNHLEFVQWILQDPSKHVTANKLYGGQRWRPALDMIGRERTDFLVREYEAALREIGWTGTSFEMVNAQNQTAYHLVFGTSSPKGMEAMKRAMRKVSPTGEFRYTDRIDPAQPVFLGLDMESDYPREIGEHLFQKYEGEEVSFDLLIQDEIDWHRWWLLPDLREGLKYLEYGDSPRIASVRKRDDSTRRPKTYPVGCFITFGSPPQARLL